MNRSIETVRYTLKQFDKEHPEQAVFPEQTGVLTDDVKKKIYQQSRRGESVDSLGNPEADSWNTSRGGTRVDWNLSPQDSLTVQGDIYRGRMNQTTQPHVFFPPYTEEVTSQTPVSGGNVLSRWNHSISTQSNLSVQMYYDRTNRDDIIIKEQRDTVDFDFQHQVALGRRHDAGNRRTPGCTGAAGCSRA
jgi:iron complex outermembrane receptor protein